MIAINELPSHNETQQSWFSVKPNNPLFVNDNSSFLHAPLHIRHLSMDASNHLRNSDPQPPPLSKETCTMSHNDNLVAETHINSLLNDFRPIAVGLSNYPEDPMVDVYYRPQPINQVNVL